MGRIDSADLDRKLVKNMVTKYISKYIRIQLNFLISHVSNEEILEIIQDLENKSTGPQSIPIKLLKLIPDLILVPLCKIINHSFSTGSFPDALKISKVIPTTDLFHYSQCLTKLHDQYHLACRDKSAVRQFFSHIQE